MIQVIAIALAATAPRSVCADSVRGIGVLTTEPVAPRGGVLMVPLTAQHAGDRWPPTLDLTFEDGSTVTGDIVWVHAKRYAPASRRRWTDDLSGLAVRAIAQTDDSGDAATGAPYLVARMPNDGDGPITLGAQTLQPKWRNPNTPYTLTPLPAFDRPLLPRIASPDRPDPDSPFEHWRWVLLADRLDHLPPSTDAFDPAEAMVAEHYANLWRIALARLAAHSVSVATACRDALTRIGTDRPYRFAAWIAQPEPLQRLLTGLLNPRKSTADLVAGASVWVDTLRPLAVWSETESRNDVELAFFNRRYTPLAARIGWDSVRSEPLLVELPPGELTRVTVPRPPLPARGPLRKMRPIEPPVHVLTVTAEGQVQRLRFGPRAMIARPPAVIMPMFRPAPTLAEIDAQRLRPVRSSHATTFHARRLAGQWELFFDCMRPREADLLSQAEGHDPLSRFESADDVRGVEAVTIVIGSPGSRSVVLSIPEQGALRLFAGDGSIEVHRASHANRWSCRVLLPEDWIPQDDDDPPFLIGARRSHADGDAVETTPHTSPPWRTARGRLAIDFTAWDE